ncbi:hypothetical protein ACTFIW_003290 [Dictyostelium discoideum]
MSRPPMVKLLGYLTLLCELLRRTPKVDLIPINPKDRLSQVTLINDDEVYTTESTDVSEAEVKLKVKNNDKIEGETLKKLIHHNFRFKTISALISFPTINRSSNRPPQPSFRDESQIIIQSNQLLQLATEEGSVQSNPTSVRSNSDGSVRISPEPSNGQLLNNQNECTPPRLDSMEAMSEDELIQFEEGFYNTYLPNLEMSNLVSEYSSTSSLSSRHMFPQVLGTFREVLTKQSVESIPIPTTLDTGDYLAFQSHVMSIIHIAKSSTAELLMNSWGTFHS